MTRGKSTSRRCHVPASGISVRAKGAVGAAAPPENFFSGKTAKIYVISKQFSGKMFGQTGFLPPKSGNFLGKKKIFFGQTGATPPSSVVPVRLWLADQVGRLNPGEYISPKLMFLLHTLPGGSWHSFILGKIRGAIRGLGEIFSSIFGLLSCNSSRTDGYCYTSVP